MSAHTKTKPLLEEVLDLLSFALIRMQDNDSERGRATFILNELKSLSESNAPGSTAIRRTWLNHCISLAWQSGDMERTQQLSREGIALSRSMNIEHDLFVFSLIRALEALGKHPQAVRELGMLACEIVDRGTSIHALTEVLALADQMQFTMQDWVILENTFRKVCHGYGINWSSFENHKDCELIWAELRKRCAEPTPGTEDKGG